MREDGYHLDVEPLDSRPTDEAIGLLARLLVDDFVRDEERLRNPAPPLIEGDDAGFESIREKRA